MKTILFSCFLCLFSIILQGQKSTSSASVPLKNVYTQYENQLKPHLSAKDQGYLLLMKREGENILKLRNPAQRKKAITQFNQKHARFRQNLLQRAKVNEQAYIQDIRRAFPQYNLQQHGKSLIAFKKSTVVKSVSLNQQKTYSRTSPISKRYSSTPQRRSATRPSGYQSPQLDVYFTNGGCGNDYNGSFSSDENTFSAFTSGMFAGGCQTTRAQGINVDIPAGIREVKVKITMDRGYVLSSAAYGMAGYGHSHNEFGIMVDRSGQQPQFFKDSELLAIAPVAYINDVNEEISGTYTMEARFVPSPQGSTYRIQAYGRSFGMGIGGGLGVGYTRLKEISKIELIYEY